jgi:hypothetical protein
MWAWHCTPNRCLQNRRLSINRCEWSCMRRRTVQNCRWTVQNLLIPTFCCSFVACFDKRMRLWQRLLNPSWISKQTIQQLTCDNADSPTKSACGSGRRSSHDWDSNSACNSRHRFRNKQIQQLTCNDADAPATSGCDADCYNFKLTQIVYTYNSDLLLFPAVVAVHLQKTIL